MHVAYFINDLSKSALFSVLLNLYTRLYFGGYANLLYSGWNLQTSYKVYGREVSCLI